MMDRLPEIDLSKLSVPVAHKYRVIDLLCIFGGALLVFIALTRGGPATLLLLPGIGFFCIGLVLLSRKRRLADPATMTAWFQEALEERYGTEANTSDGRAERVLVSMQVAAKLAELGSGEPSYGIVGGAGAVAGEVMFVVAGDKATAKRLCLLVPEAPGEPALLLVRLTAEEQERAERTFELRTTETPGILRVHCRDYHDAAAAVERAFTLIFALPEDYTAEYSLSCAQPAWVLRASGSG